MDPRASIETADAARFTEIVRRFDATVRRITTRAVRDPQAVEEVIQETWCRAYGQLSKLGDESKLEAWLSRIAKNCVIDHFRWRRRMDRHVALDEETAQADRGDWVWDLVDRLDPAHREVLRWRYREHCGYAEIAERIGAPVSTVRGRLFQARLALRRLLEQERGMP